MVNYSEIIWQYSRPECNLFCCLHIYCQLLLNVEIVKPERSAPIQYVLLYTLTGDERLQKASFLKINRLKYQLCKAELHLVLFSCFIWLMLREVLILRLRTGLSVHGLCEFHTTRQLGKLCPHQVLRQLRLSKPLVSTGSVYHRTCWALWLEHTLGPNLWSSNPFSPPYHTGLYTSSQLCLLLLLS